MKGGIDNMNKKYYISAAVVAAFALAVMSSGNVFAQTPEVAKSTMVQKLAEKLGIDQSKVQTAFDSIHSERQAEMKKSMETKLTEAVATGKITEVQKQLILKKHAEMEASRVKKNASMQNKTREERKQEMEKRKTELDAFAADNGIDLQYFFMGDHKGGRGMGPNMK